MLGVGEKETPDVWHLCPCRWNPSSLSKNFLGSSLCLNNYLCSKSSQFLSFPLSLSLIIYLYVLTDGQSQDSKEQLNIIIKSNTLVEGRVYM